jgi:hypothetical protein
VTTTAGIARIGNRRQDLQQADRLSGIQPTRCQAGAADRVEQDGRGR